MTTIRERLAGWIQKRFSLKAPPQWFVDYFGGGESSAGVHVGHQSALHYTPFWASVRIISGTLAALPFKVYERLDDGGKRPQPLHKVYALVHERPNEYMDWVTFCETRMAHVLCYGNGYAEIQRDGAGRPVALWPLLPNRTSRQVGDDGVPYYEVRTETGESIPLRDENVLHIKGLGFDGYTGYDVISYHKEAIGYGIAVKEYGARFYQNDANPGGVLECPTAMSDKAFDRLKTSWNEKYTGLSNAHRMQILEEGTKWTKIGVEPDKAQAIEAQKFTVDDCARIFQIPPHKIGSMEYSKYNNVEQLQIDFVCTTMLYWFRKWEQEINYKLFMPSERGRMFCEILADAALRGNTEARTAFYAAGRQWGYLSINDIRAKENLNPIGPAGDMYLDPLNMAPAGSLQAPKEPDPDDPGDDSTDPDGTVRKAHTDLLTAHLRRVLTKQENACRNRTPDQAWWESHRMWACEVLEKSVVAYAATRGLAEDRAVEILKTRLGEWLNSGHRLYPDQWAEIIAEDIIEKIGGHHGEGN